LTNVNVRLQELGIDLPILPAPVGLYEPAVAIGSLLFVSGQTPTSKGHAIVVGRVGDDVSVATARNAARLATLNALACISAVAGSLDRVRRVVRVTGYVRSAPGFSEQPAVVDGASEVLIQIWADAGRHARTSIGVAELPGGAPVEVELIVELRS
jgi:enamine deaminase RidA (YjgF/YER057c/UK114 family)